MTLEERIKNADRVNRANNFIVQAIEHESNTDIMELMLDVSQMISDVHKECVADFKNARRAK